ncbi:MAG: hypothetical protein ACRD0W_16675, partial [Acidimicrobiales bacterium]
MAGRKNEVVLTFAGDSSKLERTFGRVGAQSQSFGSRVGKWGKVAAVGLAGVGVAAVKMGLDFVEAAEESAKIGKQTAAVIKSTGGVAKVTAREVGKLAEKLSMKAGIDDELIQSGANVLLTFTKVRNEVGKGNDIFDRATTSALDMSVALGTDMQSSVVMLGKALNDPIRGITSMTRAGVQFTDQQKEQIRTLVESGDLLGAQQIILKELETQFGGSAEAQATASDKLKVAFGNIAEQIGTVLLPHVEAFSNWMLEKGVPLIRDQVIPALEDFARWVGDELAPDLAEMGRTLRDDVAPALKTLTEELTKVPTEAQLALASLGLLARFGGFGVLAGAAGLMSKAIAIAFGFIGFAASMAFNLILRLVPFGHIVALAFIFRDKIGGVFSWIGATGSRLFSNLKQWASTAVNAIAGFITALPGRIAHAAGFVGTLIKRGINSARDWVMDKVSDIVNAIKSIPERIGNLGSKIKDAIVGGIGKIDLSPGFDIPGVPFMQHGGI